MTALPRIPLAVPDLRGREAELLLRCVRDNWVSSAGPEVTAFEGALRELTGRRHAVALVNGTAALHMALVGAGVRPGDRVIVPDWTFAASVNAVCHAGAVPVFVDVTDEDWGLDPDLTDEVLRRDPTVKAVIAVDPLGHAASLGRLAAVCEAAGAALIEDAAGAIGARHDGRPCGAFGLVSTFSFNGNKTVTAGGGGMLVTDDDAVARHVRHISTQARPTADYVHDAVGYNYRMTNINAAVGLAQMERLADMVAAKVAIAGRYDAALAGRNDLVPMPRPAHSQSSAWLYSVRTPSEAASRDLVAAMDLAGIDARIFWRSLSAQSPWAGSGTLTRGVSAGLSGTVVSLPCSSSLGEEDQERVIAVLSRFEGRKAA